MINRLIIKRFIEEGFNAKYNVWKIRKTDDTQIISEKAKCVLSSAYISSTEFYLLCDVSIGYGDIQSVFSENHYIINKTSTTDLPKNVLINLLFNALANMEGKFNNLTAELIRVMEKKKDQFIALDFSVDEQMILSCRTKTFTTIKKTTIRRLTRKAQKAVEEGRLTAYMESDGFIVRCLHHEAEGYLVNRSYANAGKNGFDYFSISEYDNKSYEMSALLRKLNFQYGSFIEVGFEDIAYQRILESRRTAFDLATLAERFDKKLQVCVIDHCQSMDKVSQIMDKLGIPFVQDSNPKPGMINISVIKSKKAYEAFDEDDAYEKRTDVVLQNIETGNLSETSIKQCLLEMLLKKECIDRKTYVTDLSGRWDFYAFINKKTHCLTVEDNVIKSVSSLHVDERVAELMDKNKASDPKLICHDDKIIMMLRTDVRLMPDWERFLDQKDMYTVQKDAKTVNKARKYRNQLYGEIIDINTFELGGERYCSIGEIGYGMQTSVANSPSTRKIVEMGMKFEDIVRLLEPNICQLNKYAINPYPFKLMNEIFKMNGGVIEND